MIKKLIISFWLLLLVLATSWSLFRPGFFRVHDYVHAARIGEITRAMSEGQFPVRWSANFGYGYGMPLFEFYAPLPYYVGAFWYWLGVDVILVLKLLWLATSVITIWGAYRLGQELYGRSGGLVVAAAFGLAPYRALNLYVRGALSEAWGMMAMPWIMLGIILTIKKKPHGWIYLVAGLVTLFLSHNLTTMIFVPLSLVFALSYWLITSRNWQQWRQLLPIAGSYVLSFGLAAFYLIPAFTEKGLTKVAKITGGYFDFNLHFLYLRQLVTPGWGYGGSGWGPEDEISFFLGYGELLGAVILLAVLLLLGYKTWRFSGWRRAVATLSKRQSVQLVVMMTALAGVSFYMSLLKSQLLWHSVPLMSFIQFPWRWLSAGVLFLSLAAGASLWFIRWKALRAIVAGALVITTLSINWWYFHPEEYLDQPQDLYYTDAHLIQTHMSDILNDFIPIQMPDPGQIVPPTAPYTTEPVAGKDEIKFLVDRGHQKLYSTNFATPTQLTAAIAYFPGWETKIDDQKVEPEIINSGGIRVNVPAGTHLVSYNFGSTPIRQASDIVSASSFVVCLYLLLTSAKQKAKDQPNRHD